jgi:hypothetical protein
LFHNVSGINPMEIEQHRILAIKKSIGQIGKDTTYRRVQDKQVWNYSFEIKKKEILETKMVNGNEKYLVAFEPVWVTKSQLVFPHMIPNFQEFEKENQEKKQNLKRNLNENENKNENKNENVNKNVNENINEEEKKKEKKQKKKKQNKKKKENNNNNELDEENQQIDLVKKNKKSNKQNDENKNENVNNNNNSNNNNNNSNNSNNNSSNSNNNNPNNSNNNNLNNSNNNNEPIIVSDSEEEISLLNLDLEIVLKEKKNSTNLSSQYWAKLKNENQFSWKNSLPSSLLKEWNFQRYCAKKIETIDDETWILETWVLGKKIENGNLFYHLFSFTFGIDLWKKETELQNKLFIDNWQRNHFDSQSFELKEIVEECESIYKIKCQHKVHQRTAIFDFFKADIQKFYPSLIKKKG